jgi:meso-butanediol dehydrogenase/(S,S)-butanediol dehydrogenase/diacetyl reductase
LLNTVADQWNKVTEPWHQVMSNDADCVFFAVRSALPHLLQTRGAVVNVSLTAENGGDQGGVSYNTARGAVRKLTRTVAQELASQGVRVNVVSPRLTSTVLSGTVENSDSFIAQSREPVSVGRVAVAEEVAGVIAFLASEDAAFVNGIDLPVDGGFTAA